MVASYIPDRGDIVWLNFEPQKGKEINKTRPALVISPKIYNQKTGLALFLPITSQKKGYPFEIEINELATQGVILCDQVRSLDWRARKARQVTTISFEKMAKVIAKFTLLIN